MTQAITRREFTTMSVVLGAGIVLVGTSACTAGDEPKPKVATPSASFGEETPMAKRVLVGYATRNGSTVGVAEKIGETLGARGFSVDVRPMAERPSLQGYDAAVLGSAINGAQWLPEAVDFVRSNKTDLARVPVATFCVHAMNCGTDESETAKRIAYLDQVRTLISPSNEGYFAGKGPSSADTSWLALWAFRKFGGHVVEGDGRQWHTIESWTQDLRI